MNLTCPFSSSFCVTTFQATHGRNQTTLSAGILTLSTSITRFQPVQNDTVDWPFSPKIVFTDSESVSNLARAPSSFGMYPVLPATAPKTKQVLSVIFCPSFMCCFCCAFPCFFLVLRILRVCLFYGLGACYVIYFVVGFFIW